MGNHNSEHKLSYSDYCIHKGIGTAIVCHFITFVYWPLIILVVWLIPAKRPVCRIRMKPK